MELRHLTVDRQGLLELVKHVHRDGAILAQNLYTALAVYSPGEAHWRLRNTKNARRGHPFHQLFRHLRGGEDGTRRLHWARYLRHSDDLLGHGVVDDLEQPLHRPRHGNVKRLTGTNVSSMGSTVCCGTRACGPGGSARLTGRILHTATLVFCPRRASCCSCLPTRSSLNFGGNGAEEWWKVTARTVRTVCRSCFSHKRSRRSRRLLAAPLARSTSDMSTPKV